MFARWFLTLSVALVLPTGLWALDPRSGDPLDVSVGQAAQAIVDDLNAKGGSFGVGISHGDFAKDLQRLDAARDRAINQGDWETANFLEQKALRRQRYLDLEASLPPQERGIKEEGLSRDERKRRIDGSVARGQALAQAIEEVALEEWRSEESYYRSRGQHDRADQAARNVRKLEVSNEVNRLWTRQIEEKSRQADAEAKAGEAERARQKAEWDRESKERAARFQRECEARMAQFERELPLRRAAWESGRTATAKDAAAQGRSTVGLTPRAASPHPTFGAAPGSTFGATAKPGSGARVGAFDNSFSWQGTSKPTGYQFGAGNKSGATSVGSSSSLRFGSGTRR